MALPKLAKAPLPRPKDAEAPVAGGEETPLAVDMDVRLLNGLFFTWPLTLLKRLAAVVSTGFA